MNITRSFISIILPAYNEEAIIEKCVGLLTDYLKTKEDEYDFEILLINDGSSDMTGKIADSLAASNSLIRVIHHPTNLNLGRSLQTGFKNAHGDIMIVLDLDFSYSVDHIERLIKTQLETDADIVIASPYMKGGKVIDVPFNRAILSKVANMFMRFAAQEKYYTFTGMVRAYKASFIKNLNLKSKDFDINPEILYKAMILRSVIVEIPAQLDWRFQNEMGKKRTSGMRLMKSFFSSLMAGFVFRPYLFFMSIGFFLLFVSFFMICMIFINTFHIMSTLQAGSMIQNECFTQAMGIVFQKWPHAILVAGITLILSIQILSLGFISLQNKRYFEELFHISTSIFKQNPKRDSNA
jgi:dolichol-phosphate mannosyltransferase